MIRLMENMEIDRRDFLKGSAILFGTAIASAAIQNLDFSPLITTKEADVKFEGSQLGTVLNIRGLEYRRVRPEAVLELPYKRTRVPIPFDYVCPDKPGNFDWNVTDTVMDLAVGADKDIEIQFGAKTVGWPEVNVPDWFLREFKYLDPEKNGGEPVTIDKNPKAQEVILDYEDKAARRYLNGRWADHIKSVFVENEAFSKNLNVADYRYISFDFYEDEVELVRNHDDRQRPLVQNPPFDTPKAILYVLRNSDIIGINYYNQIGEDKPTKLARWNGVLITAEIARKLGKKVRITEFQGEKWNTYPFSWSVFFNGLGRIKDELKPGEGTYIWGVEWTLASGDKEQIRKLHALAA